MKGAYMTTHTYPSGTEKTLSAKQRQVALLLASGSTIDNAARVVGCGEKTIDIWKKQCAFQQAVRDAEDTLYDESLALLKKSMRLAIACLMRNTSERVTPYVQVMAASKLLDAALEVHKIQLLEARVAELEEMMRSGQDE
jgi:hypothetical protein